MDRDRMLTTARGWSVVVGLVLLGAGIAGFMETDLAGRPDSLLTTDRLHDGVHVATGLAALAIGLGMRGAGLANALLGFGVLYLVIFVTMLVSPDMFGMMEVPANGLLHAIHGVLALGSLGLGYAARNEATLSSRP